VITRPTSLAAYREISDNGLLSKKRLETYQCLYHHGPATASEVFAVLAKGNPRFNWNTRARFTELRDLGVIQEIGTRACRVTNMSSIVWEVTDRLPIAPTKRAKPHCATCKCFKKKRAKKNNTNADVTIDPRQQRLPL
jgi:hypothetical protein